jgi:predicted component of type VI protein secretion system
MGLLIPVMELYITVLFTHFYKKIQRNKIQEMELKREASEVKTKMKNFIIAYIKMVFKKMGLIF